jgi:hypothetical protein
MDELKMISYALLGIVAVVGVTSLVLLFSGALSAQVVTPGLPKVYVYGDMGSERIISPTDPSQVPMEYSLRKGNVDKEVRYVSEVSPSQEMNPCYPDKKAQDPRYYDYTVVDSYGRAVPCEKVRISQDIPRG